MLPGDQRESKAYNDAGKLIATTDFNGVSARYDYDSQGRAERIDYANDADFSMAYSPRGERTSVTDARGESTMQFDARGRVLQGVDADGGIIECSPPAPLRPCYHPATRHHPIFPIGNNSPIRGFPAPIFPIGNLSAILAP